MFMVNVKGQLVVEGNVGAHRSAFETSFRAVDRPAGTGDDHAVGDEISTVPLDAPCVDGPSSRQRCRVIKAGSLVGQVGGEVISLRACCLGVPGGDRPTADPRGDVTGVTLALPKSLVTPQSCAERSSPAKKHQTVPQRYLMTWIRSTTITILRLRFSATTWLRSICWLLSTCATHHRWWPGSRSADSSKTRATTSAASRATLSVSHLSVATGVGGGAVSSLCLEASPSSGCGRRLADRRLRSPRPSD